MNPQILHILLGGREFKLYQVFQIPEEQYVWWTGETPAFPIDIRTRRGYWSGQIHWFPFPAESLYPPSLRVEHKRSPDEVAESLDKELQALAKALDWILTPT